MKKSWVSIKAKLMIMKNWFSEWCQFFDAMHFRPWPAQSGGFLRKIPNVFGFHLNRAN